MISRGEATVNIYKIVGLIGVALSVLAAFVTVPYAAPLIAIAGAVISVNIAAEHNVRVIVSAIGLHVLGSSFDGIPAVGSYVTSILENFGTMASGAAILIILRNMYDRLRP